MNKFYYGIKEQQLKEQSLANNRIHLEMGPGDTVFFHPLLIHGSGINRTKGFRKAISCHYAPVEAQFIDVNGTIQEKLANEVMITFLKKFGTIEIDMCYAVRFFMIKKNYFFILDFYIHFFSFRPYGNFEPV